VGGRLVVVALVLFVDALGSGLILPPLSFFATAMAASPFAVGLLIAALPVCATLVRQRPASRSSACCACRPRSRCGS
jgi:hypothetical protein